MQVLGSKNVLISIYKEQLCVCEFDVISSHTNTPNILLLKKYDAWKSQEKGKCLK